MSKTNKKAVGVPQYVHSEKGTGFDDFFHEQCKKVERSHNRIQVESHKAKFSQAYINNYDSIHWNTSQSDNLVKHL